MVIKKVENILLIMADNDDTEHQDNRQEDEERNNGEPEAEAAEMEAQGNATAGKKAKKRYRSHSTLLKLDAVDFAAKNSVEAAARKYIVQPKLIRNWKRQLPELQKLKDSGRLCFRLGRY